MCGNYTGTVWNKAVFSNCLKSLRGKSMLCRWAGMSFQTDGPEEPKECSPKLVVQDHGISSLFASAERNRGRPGTEVRSVTCRSVTGSRVPDRADTCMSADITWTWHAAGNSTSGACHAWLLTLEHDQVGRAQVERPHVKLIVDVTFDQ